MGEDQKGHKNGGEGSVSGKEALLMGIRASTYSWTRETGVGAANKQPIERGEIEDTPWVRLTWSKRGC